MDLWSLKIEEAMDGKPSEGQPVGLVHSLTELAMIFGSTRDQLLCPLLGSDLVLKEDPERIGSNRIKRTLVIEFCWQAATFTICNRISRRSWSVRT